MCKQFGKTMGRGKHNLKPRARPNRNLPAFDKSLVQSRTDLPIPKAVDGYWYVPEKLGSRLHQKSSLGILVEDGGVLLNSEEVIFCHWHRHVPLPSEDWFENQIKNDKEFLHRSILFEYIRGGGVQLVPVENSQLWEKEPSKHSHFLKWRKDQKPAIEPPESQVMWARANSPINWEQILQWVNDCSKANTFPELYIIDDEFDVTMYLLKEISPSGNLDSWDDLDSVEKTSILSMIQEIEYSSDGGFLRTNEWFWEQIGVPHASGIYFSTEELHYLNALNDSEDAVADESIYQILVSRGLLVRPGFKYGTKWRVYDQSMKETHADWLIQPPENAPLNLESLCLSVRLAEGVNKLWTQVIKSNEDCKFIGIKRILPDKKLVF
jgi:hypothetical protein